MSLGLNISFPIKNADGSPFHDLVLHKATVESTVMSLGDKITGDVYYKDNTLSVTMQEYVEYKQNPDDESEIPVKFVLVNPPTIVREGLVSDNSDLRGMTKYSFTFYHPMYMLGNFPFTDVAVKDEEERYLSQNKTFSWIGDLFAFVDKLNANLASTEWVVSANIQQYEEDGVTETSQWQKAKKTSEVLSFDKVFVGDALKTAFETWEIPFVITTTTSVQGKRFLIEFGLPSQEIYDVDGVTPYVFRFGQGLGLKNNSRNPKDNKIVTRIAGYGSERNIPYGYPQIVWYGNQDWDYTINNDSTQPHSYPIYNGIVGGQNVRLIHHPFTRTTLMPSVYVSCVFNKVSQYLSDGSANPDYDPELEIIDYYDADESYPNPINPLAPSFESHQFEEEYPHLGEAEIVGIDVYDDKHRDALTYGDFMDEMIRLISSSTNEKEKDALTVLRSRIAQGMTNGEDRTIGGSYTYAWRVTSDNYYLYVVYTSDNVHFNHVVIKYGVVIPPVTWDDTMDDNGEYIQSYFKLTLPQLSFDLYACASITEEMQINMRSGACLGCTFNIQVDWEDYKRNFYDNDGNFSPHGEQRDYTKYPDTSNGQVELIVQKDLDTFGILMPNIYQQPVVGDSFVILGISLPLSYITTAQERLDETIKEYMLENNVYYYDYPLKFDEHFLATHTHILLQIKNNNVFRFQYAGIESALYIKQITIKYGDSTLPQYDITLTDDIEIVLNSIGQVTDDVSRMRVELSEVQKYYSENLIQDIQSRLSRVVDDVCAGLITFQQGLNAIGRVVLSNEIRSQQYATGLYTGHGWRIDQLGNAELESLRVRTYLEVVELLINRMQAQEGDTLFTDNDQIEKVERRVDASTGEVSYILSLKEKWAGYFTAQQYGNILKGTINTLAAKESGVSDESGNNPDKQGSDDGGNKYYTSWMRVVGSNASDNTLGKNQIRVVLYGDDEVPSQKNFQPCELMTIARWGCWQNPKEDGISAAEKESRTRRQQLFYISTSDGRIAKLTGVNSPILQDFNYGTTLGTVPDFVKDWAIKDRLIDGRDYLYAQGVIVGDFIKVDIQGRPLINYVDCGEWVNGSSIAEPSVGHGIYLCNEKNDESLQWETHDVWHNGHKWRCQAHQPVVSGNDITYYEPTWNSAYWTMIEGNDNLTIEFVSSKGYSFRRGAVNTDITPHLFCGNVDITSDVAAEFWNWTRESESGKTLQDETWDAQHTGLVTGIKTLHLTNNDMPQTWSSANKAIFTCTVSVNDGKTTRIVDNQIIS